MKKSGSITAELSEFIADAQYKDLPDDMRAVSRDLIVDSIGCAMGGHAVDKGSLNVALARDLGGAPQATILGATDKLPLPMACLANGELINALDYDAILAPGHVAPYVLPPLLAFAEARGATGEQVVTASAVAHEVGCRVSASMSGLREVSHEGGETVYGLSPASGYGSTIFGAVAGVANLLGWSAAETRNALGLAGYAAAVPSLTKFLESEHSFHAKYTSAGVVAMNAAIALLQAERGYQGDPAVLDGEFGFWRMYASTKFDTDFLLAELGSKWRSTAAELKPYPCFRMSHSAVEAFTNIIKQHDLDATQIDRVFVEVDPVTLASCYTNSTLHNHTDAQLSWKYLLAVSAFYEPGIEWQRRGLQDDRVRALMDVIELGPSAGWAEEVAQLNAQGIKGTAIPSWHVSSVRVHTGSQTFAQQGPDEMKGCPGNPMTGEDLRAKWHRIAVGEAEQTPSDETFDRLWNIAQEPDAAQLLGSLV